MAATDPSALYTLSRLISGPRMRMRFTGFLPPSGGHMCRGPRARPYPHRCFLKAGTVGPHTRGRLQGLAATRARKRPVRSRVGLTVPLEAGSVPSGHTHAERHERPAPSSFFSAPIALCSLPSPSHVRSH